MPNFESFNRGLVPLEADPTLTIHRRGLLSLNRAAFESMSAPDAVELLYDRQAGIVGLRRIELSAGNAVYVRPATRSANGPWVISAMAYLKYYKIDTEVSRRWRAYLEGDVLCVDLTGPSAIITRRSLNRSADDA